MKHIILIILLTLGVWAEEVGVPYISKQPFGSNNIYSDDQNYFIHDNVLYDAKSFRSIRKINDLHCKGDIKGFQSLERLYVSCDNNTTYQINLQTGKSTKIDHYYDRNERIKYLTDFNLSEIVNNNMLLSADEKYVAFNERDPVSNHETFYIWDIKNKSYLDLDQKDFSLVRSQAFSHYGSKVAFFNLRNKTLNIYDIEKQQFIFSLANQKVGKYYFSDDDKYLIKASGSDVYIYSLDTNYSCVLKNPIKNYPIDLLSLNSKGEGIIAKNGLIGKFNVNECKVKSIEYPEIGGFRDVISPDKKRYYRMYRNGKIIAWNLNPFQKLYENQTNYVLRHFRVVLSDDGKYLIVPTKKRDINISQPNQSVSHELAIFDTENNKYIIRIPYESSVEGIVIKNNSLYTLSHEQVLRRYDVETFKELQKTEFNETKVIRMTFGPSGAAEIGNVLKTFSWGMDISGDGKKLIAYFSESILILDIDTFKILKSIQLNGTLGYRYFDEAKKVLYYNNKFRIDLTTLEITQYAEDSRIEFEKFFNDQDKIDIWFKSTKGKTLSKNDTLVVKSSQFIDVKSEKVLATLYEYPDGEWVIMTPEGYFDASPNGRKYINVLTSPFGTRIIDNATFKKFHKKIKIGE